jgi:ectoine hydroxylase-related dioxygenase (phytanoyl-CoA dioxygenase family)
MASPFPLSYAFTELSLDALAHYSANGFVLLRSVFTGEECDAMVTATNQVASQAIIANITTTTTADTSLAAMTEQFNNINQYRNLWKNSSVFDAVLRDSRQWKTAAACMADTGSRLLHDHVIVKTFSGAAASSSAATAADGSGNDTIPWHQDLQYWPVDSSNGLSTWISLVDVPDTAGALEIIPTSHLHGEYSPEDFLNPSTFGKDPTLKDVKGDKIASLAIPARKGDMIVMHALTWHRSKPNRCVDVPLRYAYITLWVPTTTRYAPQHADWHPLNEVIKVQPGELLEGDYFPLFGTARPSPTGESRTLSQSDPADSSGFSMFNASKVVSDQIRRVLIDSNHPEVKRLSLLEILSDATLRLAFVQAILQRGFISQGQVAELESVLERLRIGSQAWQQSRSRNVYNRVYAEWWLLVGNQLEQVQKLGRSSL